MRLEYTNISCGACNIWALEGGTGPSGFMDFLRTYENGPVAFAAPFAFILFSDRDRLTDWSPSLGNGQCIARELAKHPKLGTLVETPTEINSNTGNYIKAWIFCVSKEYRDKLRLARNKWFENSNKEAFRGDIFMNYLTTTTVKE